MNRFFAALTCAFVLLLSSTSFAASFACEGTVRTLVALSSRQIWTNVPYKVEKPVVAATKTDATKAANKIAMTAISARETTVAIESSVMTCTEIPSKPKEDPKPLTSVAPVKIVYKWVCWVKTTWHVGSKSGTIEKHDVIVTTEKSDADGEAMGSAVLQVQERAKVLLFGKKDRPTWSATDAKCSH